MIDVFAIVYLDLIFVMQKFNDFAKVCKQLLGVGINMQLPVCA